MYSKIRRQRKSSEFNTIRELRNVINLGKFSCLICVSAAASKKVPQGESVKI